MLLSAKYNLGEFCNHMRNKDPMEVMDAACVEIYTARELHKKKTTQSDFRKGSKGAEYCEDLQRLVSLVMSGSVPSGCSGDFMKTVKPPIEDLLTRYRIGNLKEFFAQL